MIDSHCHLDHEPLFKNLNQILDRSKKIGLNKQITKVIFPICLLSRFNLQFSYYFYIKKWLLTNEVFVKIINNQP